jgi:hypothetical protein
VAGEGFTVYENEIAAAAEETPAPHALLVMPLIAGTSDGHVCLAVADGCASSYF